MTLPIHLVPVGSPDDTVMGILAEALSETFAANIVTGKCRIDPRPMYDERREQYSSRLILKALLDTIPLPDRVLGVAEVDLFMPVLTFVFGEAQLSGRAAVISLHRLHHSFYGLPEFPPEVHERAIKEAVHEIGHTYGLVHCPDYRCVMTASRVVDEIDVKDEDFCTSCRARVRRSGG